MAAKNRAGVVKGTFLLPAVSKNKRVYTKQNITSAVNRMKDKINSPEGLPISMATGHAAANRDDALATVGRVTKVDMQPDGRATFEADIAPTTTGHDIIKLAKPDSDGKAFVKGVSIRGAWASDPYTVTTDDGMEATTADDLDVKGIDFTWKPGVEGAQITSVDDLMEALNDPNLFFESVDDAELFAEAVTEDDEVVEGGDAPGDGSKPYGNVTYADPGYQKDKKKRYPINNASKTRAAWAYINKPANQKGYSAAQLARVKSRIKAACKKFDINVTQEADLLTEEITEVLEAYASMCVDNGQGSISASGYTDEPGKLQAMAKRIAIAAMAGLNAMDPDSDGDIDLVGANGQPDSSSSYLPSEGTQVCTCGEPVDDSAMYCPTCGQPIPQAENEPMNQPTESTDTQEAIVPEDTPTATEPTATPVAEAAAPARSLTDGDLTALAGVFAQALAAVIPAPAAAPVEAAPVAAAPVAEAAPVAPAAPVAEAAPEAPVAEAETFTAAQVQEMIDAAKREAVEATTDAAVEAFRAGPGARKGLVAEAAQAGELTLEALSKMGSDEFHKAIAPIFESSPTSERWNGNASYSGLIERAGQVFGA